MQAFPKTEIAHVASTNHRIQRLPAEIGEALTHKAAPGSPLTLVHAEDLDAGERAACERERAIALTTEGPMVGDPKLRAQFGVEAQALIEEVLATQSDDLTARHARARSLRLQGRLREAMAGYEDVLRQAPDFEVVLDEAGSLAAEDGDRTSALRFARQSVSLNPWSSALRERLAQSLFFDRKWSESMQHAAEALHLNPFLPLPRTIRVHAALQLDDLALARQEIDTLIALNPTQRKVLEDWFDQQRRVTAQRH
jgi:tetratricopeptide (TPR) repeat protein